MKIECDKCAAKYSIADDKVRGKTFKIRCKKCGNVIIVRDKGAAGGADDAADDAGGDVAAAGWHLAVDGETVGPVADDEVRRRFRSGQIDGETAVWQEGFEDWIPLASVPAFADLVAGGGAAADPFGASGGDDPFAAGSDAGDDGFAAASGGLSAASASFGAASSGGGLSAGGGGGGLSASPAAAKAAEAANPRATQLTGQRNENSVLFSLDSLRAMAGAAPSGGGGGGGGGSASKVSSGGKPKVATSAPSSEGSGLIDIRAMGAVLGSGGGAAADLGGGGGSSSKSDDDVLPTFGGGGFGGLSATPLVVTPPPSAAAAAPEPKSNNTVLYAIVAILALALIGLGVLVVMQMNKEPVKEVVIKEVPGSVADGDKDKDEEKEKEEEERKKKEEEEKKKKEEEEKAAAEAAAGDTGGEAAGGVEGTGKTGSTKSGSKSGSGKTSGTGGTATTPTGDTGTKTETKPEPKTNPADDVDCLLDPSLAKCKGGGGSKSGSGGTKSGGSTGSTTGPEKLSQTDLLDGIKGVKASAQACGSKHGVTGVKIPVKLSIEGSTGRVISASAQGDYAGKPVGNCVAAELKKAEFKKFTSAQMGFTYNVSL
jgi:predicted Zn finger-like uncharacterized protein